MTSHNVYNHVFIRTSQQSYSHMIGHTEAFVMVACKYIVFNMTFWLQKYSKNWQACKGIKRWARTTNSRTEFFKNRRFFGGLGLCTYHCLPWRDYIVMSLKTPESNEDPQGHPLRQKRQKPQKCVLGVRLCWPE